MRLPFQLTLRIKLSGLDDKRSFMKKEQYFFPSNLE